MRFWASGAVSSLAMLRRAMGAAILFVEDMRPGGMRSDSDICAAVLNWDVCPRRVAALRRKRELVENIRSFDSRPARSEWGRPIQRGLDTPSRSVSLQSGALRCRRPLALAARLVTILSYRDDSSNTLRKDLGFSHRSARSR